MIDIQNLTQTFGESKSLFNGMNLNLNAGRFYTFCGPSGCGKSTLLRLVAGLIQPSRGLVKTSKTAALMFQDSALLPWRSVEENLQLVYHLQNRTFNSQEKAHEIDEYLELVNLQPRVKSLFPHELSGGMKARVAFVRALLSTKELLLLDEPFSALDELTKLSLHQDFRQIHDQKKITTLLVTHSISEAVFLSDEIFVLSDSGIISGKLKVDYEGNRDFSFLERKEFIQYQKSLRSLLGRI